jgi:hypothetical protein
MIGEDFASQMSIHPFLKAILESDQETMLHSINKDTNICKVTDLDGITFVQILEKKNHFKILNNFQNTPQPQKTKPN